MRNLVKHARHRTMAGVGRLVRRLAHDKGGMAAVEFAMIVPMMFFLLVGAVEFSQALTVDRRVTQAASSTADLIARAPSQGLSVSQVDSELRIIEQLIEPYELTQLTVKIVSVKANAVAGNPAALNYVVDWSRDNRGGTPYARNATYNGIPAGLLVAGESVIVAEASYNYTPLIFKVFIESAFDLSEKFYLKPRNASCVHLQPVNCVTGGSI
ncbi:MAG: TadE/TadG family type IV pilus assembly protein [Hyphomicrobiaceae bacterium]|nr:TadE/TadG family type IV pilus assembly protein [Hyphomicrobiaceae bacterium]